jgi:uncharacterized membrane protein YagU involved in acid resistance
MGFLWTAARGAAAGAVGTWVMDRVTTKVLERQSPADTARERAAWPNGKPSVENLVDLGAERLGITLQARQRERAIGLVHYGLGMGPGVLYALLRKRVPLLGAGMGLVYGLLLFAVNDELLNTALGLSGPPEAYPASSHLRGLVGHLALGVTTDLALIG